MNVPLFEHLFICYWIRIHEIAFKGLDMPTPCNERACAAATAYKEFHRSIVSQLIFAKQGLNFISRLCQSFVMKIYNRLKVSK